MLKRILVAAFCLINLTFAQDTSNYPVGTKLAWKHDSKDILGNDQAPDGFILYYRQGEVTNSYDIPNPSSIFVESQGEYIFNLMAIDELVGKANCLSVSAYYNLAEQKAESTKTPELCAIVGAKPSAPTGLRIIE